MTYFDSHTHVQIDDFDADRSAVLQRAADAGVREMLCIGFDLETSRTAIQLASEISGLYATVGVHPHEAKTLNGDLLDLLRSWTAEPNVVALGEMGLDFYRNLSPRDAQFDAFEAQLRLAAEVDLPVVIHDREAHDDVLQVLRAYAGRVRGVMHCFSGDWKMAQECIDLGFLISIAGPVTYRKANQLHEVARRVPLSRLLIETDCPWLAPQFRRGRRNEPAYVVAVAERIAELKRISVEEVAAATTENARALFL